MARDPKVDAALALHRFGGGPRPGSITAIASDPRGALLAELERPGVGLISDARLPSSAQAARDVFEFRAERQAAARRAKLEAERKAGEGMEPGAEPQPAKASPAARARGQVPLPRRLFMQEAKARIDAATGAEIGLVERLVWFWSNHFCVSASKVLARAGGYEREAIRPHVLGRFVDMLLAAESHPAMLAYLDNQLSMGPNSTAGVNRTRGLNENLAREILELHTLGVRSVYTQEDVTSFAKVLTGWTIIPPGQDPERGGEFVFIKRLHEPGPQTVLGKAYADTGVEQGRAVLRDLAHHAATAKHIATKLAAHFVADAPPPTLVERLTQRFLDTDGDLKELAKVIITAPEAWDPPVGKLKRPGEWLVAALRATGLTPDIRRILRTHTFLGEPLWRPSAPKGFPDDEAAWSPGIAQRVEIATAFAQRVADRVDVPSLIETALGPLASPQTRDTIGRAESRAQALVLLLMAPEFQRR